MSKFQVVFVELRNLEHRVIGTPHDLKAATREAAIREAADLYHPPGANFVQILDDSKATAWLLAAPRQH